jgi:hypothetical protein
MCSLENLENNVSPLHINDTTSPEYIDIRGYFYKSWLVLGFHAFSALSIGVTVLSVLSANGIGSLLSANSFFSILSVNSAFSIFSANSAFAIGCANKNFSICF